MKEWGALIVLLDKIKLSKAAKKRHIDSAGVKECPYCRADHNTFSCGELMPVESGHIEQRTGCEKCDHVWIDVFQLVDVRETVQKLSDGPL